MKQKEYYDDLKLPLSADEFIAAQQQEIKAALTMLDKGMPKNKKVEFSQLPNPKGLGRPLHRRSIVTCGCTGAIYCHRNTTLPIIFRAYSRRLQGARFICALKARRFLYPLTRAN